PLLRTLGAVMRTALLAVFDALRVEHAAEDVVANARQVLDAAAADQHDAVFLQVVALARDIAHGFDLRGQTDLGDLTQSRVRLLRRGGVDAGANASALRAALQGRHLVALRLGMAGLADQLVDCGHRTDVFLLGCPTASLLEDGSCSTAPLLQNRSEACAVWPEGFGWGRYNRKARSISL